MALDPADCAMFAALRTRAPRVQCLTNTVAQSLTANVLHAMGARVSMATHPDEVIAMTASADAVLINLGTLDEARVMAIPRLLDGGVIGGKPVVLDPVFAQHSPLRLALAKRVLQQPGVIVKGNREEIAAVRRMDGVSAVVWVTTGPKDLVEDGRTTRAIDGGHRWMSAVTGMGCALGAAIAAVAAVEPDRTQTVVAALRLFADAGARAGHQADGPGSFAVAFLDALERLTLTTVEGQS